MPKLTPLRRPLAESTIGVFTRRGVEVVAAHIADHRRRGESLVGRQREFALRCQS